ncbi:hypothetical protein [Hymenobacter cheonanensis]|uniref:hypothetical protein n=1 Tax=Hymenobacter sp. CA2-7 TaxID=3063993 RepID=UPI002713B221|nr:hypothetical protein [Hymenobacter sp. CA2-7]MDO7885033.1 hypothetical protein [Hymenobacter sp. CA2-7]
MTFSILSNGSVVRWLAATSVATGLSLAGQPAAAQQAPATIRLSPEDEGRGQYGAQHNFYFLPPGKTGEENYQSAGFFGGKLRPYLAGNASALAELDHYQGHKTAYLIDKAVLVGSLGLYASQVFGHGDAQYFSGTQQVALGLTAASLLGTLFINRHTNEYLKQAVDNYNTGTAGKHGTLWPRLRPAGLGLAATAGHPVLALRWQL